MPVVENVVEAGEVACRRFGGAVRIATFVHPPVLTQAVGTARGGNELPHAHGVGAGHGHGIVSAFQIGEIGEIFGESAGTEHALGVVQIGNAVSQEVFHGSPAFARVLHEVITHLPFHARAQIFVQLGGAGIRLFLRGSEGGKRTQIHGFLPGLGSQQVRGFHRLLFAAGGKHHQHCHSRKGKAAQFANFHVSAPSCGLASRTKAGYQPESTLPKTCPEGRKKHMPADRKHVGFPEQAGDRGKETGMFPATCSQ